MCSILKRGAQTDNDLKVKEGRPGDVVDVMVKLQLAVKTFQGFGCVGRETVWLSKGRRKFCTVRGGGLSGVGVALTCM